MSKLNSDKSGRDARQKAEREVAKTPVPLRSTQNPSAPDGGEPIRVNTTELFTKIGTLTVENDILRTQLAQRNAQITAMAEKMSVSATEEAEKVTEPEPPTETPAE